MNNEKTAVELITAVDNCWGLGKNNKMAWTNKNEMQHFVRSTRGNIVILGSKTIDGLVERVPSDTVYNYEDQRILPGRSVIVVTSKEHLREYVRLGLYVVPNLEAALEKARELVAESIQSLGPYSPPRRIFIAGGASLYRESLEKGLVDNLIISHVKGNYDCDTFFPALDITQWTKSTVVLHWDFTIETYSRKVLTHEPALTPS